MAVEAATNRLQALVQKVSSDLDYAKLKLSNEFMNNFKEDFPNELNPVSLIERLQKAKEEYKILMDETANLEDKQKIMSEELQTLTSDVVDQVFQLQMQSGVNVASSNDMQKFLGLGQENTLVGDGYAVSRHATDGQFNPVTEEEFLNISDLVRGRSKLTDVNLVYGVLHKYFQKHRKASALSVKDMVKMGLKVSGATGNAKLKVLKALNIIEIDKDGGVKMQS